MAEKRLPPVKLPLLSLDFAAVSGQFDSTFLG
jgi:hypothetical protein